MPAQVQQKKTVFFPTFLIQKKFFTQFKEKKENTDFRKLLDVKNVNSYDLLITTPLFYMP